MAFTLQENGPQECAHTCYEYLNERLSLVYSPSNERR